MKLLVFNVKYSLNVGDGIVAETTEYLLSKKYSRATIRTLDLGGRFNYGTQGIKASSSLKQLVNKTLSIMPNILGDLLRLILTSFMLNKQVFSLWEKEVIESDYVLIGGGQLIADTELYFPIRLFHIARMAKKHKKDIFIHAVGVSDSSKWSYWGKKLFLMAFKNNEFIKYISVRDKSSARNWQDFFGTEAIIVPDTGHFSKYTYQIPLKDNKEIIGINVMCADEIISHTSKSDKKVILSIDDYLKLAQILIKDGYNVSFFTNGAIADEEMLKKIRLRNKIDKIKFLKAPLTAADLVKNISECERIIAQRLHACIVSHSLGKAVLGLAWDKKLTAYFDEISRSEYFIDEANLQLIADKIRMMPSYDNLETYISLEKYPFPIHT